MGDTRVIRLRFPQPPGFRTHHAHHSQQPRLRGSPAGLPAAPPAARTPLPAALPTRAPPSRQCPNKSVGANMPFASKWASASSTVRKILVAVSVMNGLGFFFGFHTT